MGRANGGTVLATQAIILRRAACRAPSGATEALDESADALQRAAVEQKPHYSKSDAAEFLNVSRPTLDKWIASGLLLLEDMPGKQRKGIPAKALITLANEVAELREMGQNRGLLAAALERLHQESPELSVSFIQTHKMPSEKPAEYVSAAPGPAWDPEDEWDIGALDFDEEDK